MFDTPSNDMHELLRVSDPGMDDTPGGSNDSVVATVINETKGVSLNITMLETATAERFQADFYVVAGVPGVDEIAADHDDILSASYTTETGIVMNFRNSKCFETLEVDTQGPTFSNRTPLDLTQSASQSVILQVDVEDPAGIEFVAFYLDGEIVQPTKVVQTPQSPDTSWYTHITAFLHLTMPAKVYTWRATAMDDLGNTSNTEQFTLEIQ